MLRHIFIFFVLAIRVPQIAQLPFKYDNTIYKAVYLNEAFELMDASPATCCWM